MTLENDWYTTETEVRLPEGIHLRPAASIVSEAQRYPREVVIQNMRNKRRVDAKCAMDLPLIEAYKGDRVRIYAERGEGCEEVVSNLVGIISPDSH